MAGDNCLPLVLFGLYWLLYFAIHSLLASLGVKRAVSVRWPGALPYYRVSYNLVAVLLLLPALVWVYRCPGETIWAWTGPAWWLAQVLAVLALIGFLYTLRDYDGAEFLGIKQWRDGQSDVEDMEQFHVSPLHRFIRHPWYFLGLVLVWTRDMSAAWMLTSVAVTLYFLMGSRLEERKLLVYHGEVYAEYRRLVPGLIPLPWRWLSKEKARGLAARAGRRAV